MEMRGIMGGFYKISEWIMRLSVTNVLWAICSIPFWFFVFSALFLPTSEQGSTIGMLYVAIAVSPFTLFPATAAMFTVARKWVMGEVDVPLFKTFFRGYKENFLQSMLGGLLYAVLFAIMVVDLTVYRSEPSMQLISFLFIGFLFILIVSLFNFFSMLVHYHMKTFQLLKNAVLITIGRPFRSIGTLAMAIVVLMASWKFTFLFPFFTGSVIAFLSYWNFNLIYQKMQAQAEKLAAAEAEQASNDESEDETSDIVTGKK
ncbi:protein of unknown function DUF624 [Paenibacillus curdlanolyticus YK9]|uniref:Integral membrane protein n=1 Tax=Paenibacillus curdlanolyticus YK9 TaxID=717606 RepID=E0I2Z5_9BACL|nr:DUF624 domain-containing protein [Paenibacillus curdlanolyticus]EFM12659.1 protein of unknown function DUF624 [Paenibacillus curdlanolyticus YK9]